MFYNPDNPAQITSLGEIWIYKATIMWGSLCLLMGVPGCCAIFYDQWFKHCMPGNHFPVSWDRIDIFCRGFCWFLASITIFAFGSLCGILACEIIFFSPLAMCMYSYVFIRI